MDYQNPHYLTTTEWLHENLDREDLRIFDCTTYLKPDPDKVFIVESGKPAYDEAHIPSSAFIDLQSELSDQDSRLRFTLPSTAHFESVVGKHGVSNDSHVVLYSTTMPMWATRVWWMFRLFGHDRVSVLDGGFNEWKKEFPVCEAPCGYPEATFKATMDDSRYADLETVRQSIEDGDTCIINSLSREQHRGEGMNYGRPGRIKGSKVLPAAELIDPETGKFLPAAQLNDALESVDALGAEKVITYCGGGIAASTDLFVMALMGKESNVALYDGSLSEWANTPDAPMESD